MIAICCYLGKEKDKVLKCRINNSPQFEIRDSLF